MASTISMMLRSFIIVGSLSMNFTASVYANESLFLAYPPKKHQTKAEQIFFIGTAPPQGEVSINGEVIERSPGGHFAPSFPLTLGENRFQLRYGNQSLQVTVNRLSNTPTIPTGVNFAPNSLTPTQDIARLPGELLCFQAIAPPAAQVNVEFANQTFPLVAEQEVVQLPLNSAVLMNTNQPISQNGGSQYQGCTVTSTIGSFGNPVFQLSLQGKTIKQTSSGKIEILNPNQLEVIEVTVKAGVARTGPSTDYSRLTPLPQGTRARVTGREGEWLRLDYGGWIKASETRFLENSIPPQSLIRSVLSRQVDQATEIVFPLQVPVPISVNQGDDTFTLTLHNTTAQTDTIRLDDDPLIRRLDWQQVTPNRINYTFHLKTSQQWGYDLRYEGTSLILTLRHPPQTSSSLKGITILLDPGHGGRESGAIGPNGYPEKDVNLVVSKLLQQELIQRGATVYMTRETDIDVSLNRRREIIDELKPTLALSIHYNALPDGGDAMNTAGIGMFWYHTQAHDLAISLQNSLVKSLNRPSYGVFWNNLALTRPHSSPSVLLELGFMINPFEFEWIVNPQEQKKLAEAIADGVEEWLKNTNL